MKKINISIKVKAVLDNLNGDERVTMKGPFEVKMLRKLSTGDKYKYAVVVLFENNFRPESAEVLEKIGLMHTVLKKKMLKSTICKVLSWNHIL